MQALKLYCVFSHQAMVKMQGNRGKMAAMAGHAYLHAWWNSLFSRHFLKAIRYLLQPGAIKICLVVHDPITLQYAIDQNSRVCGTTAVRDSSTVFEGEEVFACVGIGPVDPSKVKYLPNLPLLI